MKNCLIYLISPTHFISAISAIKSLYPDSPVNIINMEVVNEIYDIINKFSKNYDFINKIKPVSSQQKEEFLSSNNIELAINVLKNQIGKDCFDEIYYSHDIDGGMYQFLCSSYPDAQRICLGDCLGNVYEKEILLSLLKPVKKTQSILSLAKRLIKVIFKIPQQQQKKIIVFQDFKPHQAVLILPVDQSGNFFENIPLTVCKKDIVMKITEQCISCTAELQNYITNILTKYNGYEKYLLLTENHAEANFIDFDKEIEMYSSLINKYCHRGSVVFLKSHPGETLPRNEKIKEKISDNFEIVELDKKFKRYPVEIWKNLVINCNVICMSYPVLSLKYLYNLDVIQPMNNELIEKWFNDWTWASYKNNITLCTEPTKNLANWDGNSVLYAGNISKAV